MSASERPQDARLPADAGAAGVAGQQQIVVAFAIPPSPLHPNVSAHYLTKARWAKIAREEAMLSAYNVRPPVPFTRCRARATFHFRQARHRDPDNLIAWLKHSIDGLTDAAIWVDDSVVIWEPVEIIVDHRQKAGVVIIVTPAQGEERSA